MVLIICDQKEKYQSLARTGVEVVAQNEVWDFLVKNENATCFDATVGNVLVDQFLKEKPELLEQVKIDPRTNKTCLFLTPTLKFYVFSPIQDLFENENLRAEQRMFLEVLVKLAPLENERVDLETVQLKIEGQKETFLVVKELPKQPLPAVKYLTLEQVKDLSRIFDIIDAYEAGV